MTVSRYWTSTIRSVSSSAGRSDSSDDTRSSEACSVSRPAGSYYTPSSSLSDVVFTPLYITVKVTRWCNGKAFGLVISRLRVQILLEATLRNNLRQVVYTYVPLSQSSITWYRPKGGDALRLGRYPQAWRKVIAAYRRVDDLRSPAG